MTTNEHKPLEGLADYLRTMACNKEYSDSRRASLRVWADEVEAASLPCTRSHPHENMSAECERLTAIARENNEVASLPQGDVEGLSAVYDEFGIGALAREPHILLENVRNVHRRERCLSAIEREFFTIETPPDPDEGDEEPGEECLLNWGADPAEYVEQFRDALASRLAAPASNQQGSFHQAQPSGEAATVPRFSCISKALCISYPPCTTHCRHAAAPLHTAGAAGPMGDAQVMGDMQSKSPKSMQIAADVHRDAGRSSIGGVPPSDGGQAE
jgi:hypothetical protein